MLWHLDHVLAELVIVHLDSLFVLQELLAFRRGWYLNEQEMAFSQEFAINIAGLLLVITNLKISEFTKDSLHLFQETLVYQALKFCL